MTDLLSPIPTLSVVFAESARSFVGASEMKFQAGTKPSVARQDSKCRKFKKMVCDLPVLQGEKTRCTPISALSNMIPRASAKSCLIWFSISLLGVLALLHVGSFVTGGQLLSQVSILGVRASYWIGRQWRYQIGTYSPNYTYPGFTPPFVLPSSECDASVVFSHPATFLPSMNSSSTIELDFDLCLAVSIGDDGDRPNDEALPYPLVSRLIDALKEEIAAVTKDRPSGSLEVVQVLVGVDYGSIVCPIVRDTFYESAGVMAQCRRFSKLELGTKCGKLVVGHSKRFVPQLPEEWNDVMEWQSRRMVDLDCPDPSHQPPAIPEKDWQPTLVTGFSSNHMTVGLLMLRSIGKAAREGAGLFNLSVVVWAMEVFDDQHQGLLDCVIDELNHEYGVKAEVRLFDWSAHPSWVHIHHDLGYFGGTGEYAWKAIMVHTVLRERGFVLWGDAGDRFLDTDSLIETLKVLNSTGFVSRNSHGYVYTRTHPLHLKYYRANLPGIWDLENCEAAIVGFTLKKYSELARPWYDCSITRQCIAPDGSDRSNHRQDQAALTLLSILSKNPCQGAHPNFSDHLDNDPTLRDVSGAYLTKCYIDPLDLSDQGTLKPPHRPHGIIN